jgi:hypothetical protein
MSRFTLSSYSYETHEGTFDDDIGERGDINTALDYMEAALELVLSDKKETTITKKSVKAIQDAIDVMYEEMGIHAGA